MITLTDVRNDLRIRKEAQSLATAHELFIISNIEALPAGPMEFLGLRVFNVRMKTRRLPRSPFFWVIKYAEFFLRAVRQAAAWRADVYHGHDLPGAVPAMFAARLRRAKFIYDAHELEADEDSPAHQSRWLRRVLLFFLRMVIGRADHVICASESRARIMVEDYAARALPTAILNVTPRAGLPMGGAIGDAVRRIDFSGKRVVLYQGNLAHGRGLERLVGALRMLPDDVVLLMVGGGAAFDELKAQAESEGIGDRLIMTGQVPADSLVAYMKLAHVGVAIYRNTCRNNYFCAPNKIYEYASIGLPVVGPNFPDVESVVTGRNIGRTFDPDDPSGIAAAIRAVLESAERRAEMSANALKLKDEVNWEAQEAKLLNLYRRVLSANP